MIDRNSFISNYPRSQITHDIDYYWLFELVQIIYKIYRTIYGTGVLDDDDESRSIVCPWVYRSRRGRGPLRFISLGKWILLNSTSCDSNNYTIDVTQLPSNIDPILSILTLLPSTRIFHASHFPSLSLSLVVESLTGLPRADRRLSRFCARLTAVCAEPATRLAVLTVPHKARHDRCVPRVIVITRVVLIPREVIDTINKSAGTYRLARSHVDQAGGRMGLDYRAQ